MYVPKKPAHVAVCVMLDKICVTSVDMTGPNLRFYNSISVVKIMQYLSSKMIHVLLKIRQFTYKP